MLLGAALALLIGWTWFGGLFRWVNAQPSPSPAPASPPAAIAPPTTSNSTAPAVDARKIRATLFYVAENGVQLIPVDREVGYADDTSEQARLLLEALIKPVDEPMVSAIPKGVTLKTVLLSEKGDAFVDFSPELATNHTGGSLDELLTVYAIVDTLTVNLPAIARVQILIDGKQAETLAGHIDLRRPLAKNLTWTRPPENAPPPDTHP
jgi:spore germination protein GerM